MTVACLAGDPFGNERPGAPVAVTITSARGETIAFDPAESAVAATGPVSITFRNGSSLPHNLTFTVGVTAATRTIVEPGTSDEVHLSALDPGAYPFVCTIHDGMTGTLTIRER